MRAKAGSGMSPAGRRAFLAAAAAAAAVGALRAFAQAPAQPRRIGYLSNRASLSEFDRAFVRGLAELGYVDGRNVAIDFRFNAGDFDRLRRTVDELVATRPDVIVTSGPAVRVVARATSTIPIVMAAIADPVGQGVATKPGTARWQRHRHHAAIDGARDQAHPAATRAGAGLRRLALLAVRGDAAVDTMRRDASVALAAEAGAAARNAGIALIDAYAREARELPDALARFRRERAQALIVQVAPLTFDARQTIFAFARAERLPALFEVRLFPDDGGLMSYGRTSTRCTGGRQATWTRSCAARSRPSCRSSSRASSSWSSTSGRRRRSGSRSPTRSCCARTT
jgi:putative ABC transport system substrate-binding protein